MQFQSGVDKRCLSVLLSYWVPCHQSRTPGGLVMIGLGLDTFVYSHFVLLLSSSLAPSCSFYFLLVWVSISSIFMSECATLFSLVGGEQAC